MLFSVVAISCLLAVQAVPLGGYIGSGIGLDLSAENIGGVSFGIGRRRIGGGVGLEGIEGERLGSEFGRRGSERGSREYGSREYEREGGSSSHERGHLNQDFKKTIESHVSESHDAGRSEGYGTRGHERGGHSRYGADENLYGGRFRGDIGI